MQKKVLNNTFHPPFSITRGDLYYKNKQTNKQTNSIPWLWVIGSLVIGFFLGFLATDFGGDSDSPVGEVYNYLQPSGNSTINVDYNNNNRLDQGDLAIVVQKAKEYSDRYGSRTRIQSGSPYLQYNVNGDTFLNMWDILAVVNECTRKYGSNGCPANGA